MTSERLAAAVADERGSRGWSQQELAERAGISLATIGALERPSGRRFNLATLGRLDDVFGWDRGHARTLMIDAEAHDTLADLPPTASATPVTVVIDGHISSVATANRGEQLSRIITVETEDGVWMLSRVSSASTRGAAIAAEQGQAMPVPVEGDHIHYAFHFVPKA